MSDSQSDSEMDESNEDNSQTIPMSELLDFCEENGLKIAKNRGKNALVPNPVDSMTLRKPLQQKDIHFIRQSVTKHAKQLLLYQENQPNKSTRANKKLVHNSSISNGYNHNHKTTGGMWGAQTPKRKGRPRGRKRTLANNDIGSGNPISDSEINQVAENQNSQLLQDFNSGTTEANHQQSTENDNVRRGKVLTPSSRIKRRRTWKQTSNQEKRMLGEEYIGYKTETNPTTNRKVTTHTVPRKARHLKPACVSNYCKKSKLRHCLDFSEVDRTAIWTDFWKMNWGKKQTLVKSLVDKIPTRHSKKKETARERKNSYCYFLRLNGRRLQVCQNMFLNTLSLGRDQVTNWIENDIVDKPKLYTERKRRGGDRSFYKEFLNRIPKLPSHYCRQNTTKQYLEPQFFTMQDVYKAYKSECDAKGIVATSTFTFSVFFRQQNYALHQPKKDMCDTCSSKDVENIDKEEYESHILKKDSARAEKNNDKRRALAGDVHVLTMDVQKVLLSPMLNASALYYKTKLIVHNFTVYDLKTHDAACYLFDETEAELVSSTFATCLTKYFDDHYNDNLPIIIYSDGCTSQNRNAFMSAALLRYAMEKNKIIIQKILEKGHTQMECDAVHGVIERKLKGRSIYVPADYVTVCKEARLNPHPYEVVQMHHGNIYDYSKIKCNIRPGSKKGDPVVTDLRQLMYDPTGSIKYKLNHTDCEWVQLPRNCQIDLNYELPMLYSHRLPIAKRKYQDLMDLLHVIPACYHEFYKNLPHKLS